MDLESQPVRVSRKPMMLPTYEPAPPDRNPMFLEKRVYQGSSGKVYPLPMISRISSRSKDVSWDAIHLENEYLYVMILPQLGGRIHILRDKTNGYDAIYNQPVIKPALVGLTGPWASGGIEFNWPQHHRPSTFLPADVEIEHHADGSVTVWLSEHDPMARMKGMHGVCLHPGRAVLEIKARVYNRTSLTQTFLWWANVAVRVHEGYQSFFPPDARFVADHAKRAMSGFPQCRGSYYGVDYGSRRRRGVPPGEVPGQFIPQHCLSPVPDNNVSNVPDCEPDDLSWYANIPVPTSYMCMGTREDFFGGYDHLAEAGLLHIADRHIAPGKKQWTWGNHAFGYAWDRNLTDPDADGVCPPYIELMSGVYTDNQPDFSFLGPGETKSWSHYWYPIRKTGPACHANLDAAIGVRLANGRIRLGVSVTRQFPNARIIVEQNRKTVVRKTVTLAPDKPYCHEQAASGSLRRIQIVSEEGAEILTYTPCEVSQGGIPETATEPPFPGDIASTDELYITGLHLDQYRHATRSPVSYWREALRRDPGDARCNNAMGLWHLRRGEFPAAESHFRRAIERLTRRNPNPADGEPFYNLGLCLRHLGRDPEAYDAFYKAVWNHAWCAAGYHALAEMDCCRHDWSRAVEHVDQSLRHNTENLRARNLKVMLLRRLDRDREAGEVLRQTLSLDPLDWWARYLNRETLGCDAQVRLDLSHDCLRCGFHEDAAELLRDAKPEPGTVPLVAYTLAWVFEKSGKPGPAGTARRRAKKASSGYCFPARLEEIAVLESAMAADSTDARAPYYLGNLFYDRRRHEEAIVLWQKAVRIEPGNAVAWRNLGIGWYNILKSPPKARTAYERAFRANPRDARLLFERDQLWKRMAEPPEKRLRELERYPALVQERDDLSLERCALYNQTGQPEKALPLISVRLFQPWEGGEGITLGQHVRTHLAIGRRCLKEGDLVIALSHFHEALSVPGNLGEGRHPLANASDIHYWLGQAFAASGDSVSAGKHWKTAAKFRGDFQNMSIQPHSELTYYSAVSLECLDKKSAARELLQELLKYARDLEHQPATIDYFATSLPTMLLFDEDLQARQSLTARFLQAQALSGLGKRAEAGVLLAAILREDPNHALAADFSLHL